MTPIGRVLFQVAGLPGLDGTRATERLRVGHRRRRAAARASSARRTCPSAVRRDWVMNANDSYWLPNPAQKLEGFARIIGCEKCQRTLRTRMVDHYVIDALAKGKISPTTLRGFEHQNRVMGAEVMSAGRRPGRGLQAGRRWRRLSRAARPGTGTPTSNSRGNQIFEEFVTRLPTVPLVGTESYWVVPFDENDPVDTPRDLDETNPQVIQAMKDAIAYLRSKNVPMNATWGSLQVAGDTGAPPIPLGGGLGDEAGNANALASRNPVTNSEPLQAGHLRLLAHPGDLVPRRRRRRHEDDPDLRPVRGPDVALVEGPDRDVRQEAVGQLPVHPRPDQQASRSRPR